MKFLIDNNLSFRLKSELKSSFSDTHHVSDFKIERDEDIFIWNYARENDFIIVTKDNDFEFLSLMHGCPPKVIQILAGNVSTKIISDLLLQNKEEISSFNDEKEICLLKLH